MAMSRKGNFSWVWLCVWMWGCVSSSLLPIMQQTALVSSISSLVVGQSYESLAADGEDDYYLDSRSTILDPSGNDGNGQGYVQLDFAMRNVSKYRTQQVRLRCEITGSPIPAYSWFKNATPLRDGDEGGRISIRLTTWGSRLRLDDLRSSDTGYYTCKAVNKFGEEETTGILIVANEDPPPEVKDKSSKNKDDEDDPDFSPFIPGQDGDDLGGFNGKYDSRLLPGSEEKEEKGEGFCQIYRGSTCSKFVGNMSIYVESKFTQGLSEEKLVAAFAVIASSHHLSQRCQDFGIPSLCYHAFPLCDDTGDRPRPRQICRDECEVLENDVCKTEYVLAKSHRLIGDRLLPDCLSLKGPGTPEGDNCVRVNVPNVDSVNNKHKCYNGTGAQYMGRVSETKSGIKCQKWNSDSPHAHSFKSSKFPELAGGHNYCRNPGGSMSGPWCFTVSERVQKELCDIPTCVTERAESNKLMFILVPSITIPLALAILLAIVCFCQRRGGRGGGRGGANANGKTVGGGGGGGGGQPVEMSPLNPKPSCRAKEFPAHSIRYMQELGEGAFGKVYKGELLGLYGDSTVSKVAIKTLKENAAPKMQNDFRREVDLMSEMRHPNIVCLLGVCLRQEPMCMLFEFMVQGDLHEYLIMHSPHSDISGVDTSKVRGGPGGGGGGGGAGGGAGKVLEYPEMLVISTQIAAGMEYLASHHFVHRDLAARNVLVGDGLTVKISDFGLSRDIYSSDYYRVQSKSLLPVRWMPPESIMYGKFTTDSDVWSFGVVLWEVFSFGLQPYFGCSNQEVIEMIRSRQLLPQPEDCPGRVYGLMMECWNEIPSRRPPFRECHARLRSWKGELMAAAAQSNPHWSLSQSQSAHSSSTGHQSSQSQPSHHSSTGPSNNTAMTGLTGSSNTSDPNSAPGGGPAMGQGHLLGQPNPHFAMSQGQLPPHMMVGGGGGPLYAMARSGNPSSNLPPAPAYSAFNGQLSKASPATSVTSSKSSNSGASASSGQGPYTPSSLAHTHPHLSTQVGNGGVHQMMNQPVPAVTCTPPAAPSPPNDKLPPLVPGNMGTYIPSDQRTADT
ncbi:inactive tyrosine-protein kinase transmembrane receptor ROR1-like [Babylonia areolata]|uniref:inactive tyrosine-protein kinase transmembrane receptor ROR1-like n=1 Tax=Babylonia areolata TaxID=304850 RepID=UPI003FD49581